MPRGRFVPKVISAKSAKVRTFFFSVAEQLVNSRLPSFKEGSCRRRRLRGVEGLEGSRFCVAAAVSEFLGGLSRKKICGSAVRQPLPSSGRKVARASVTEGARGTSNQQKAEVFQRFQGNPSPASRQPPLPQGRHESVQNYGKYQRRFFVPPVKKLPHFGQQKEIFRVSRGGFCGQKKVSIKILRNTRLFVHFSPSARRRPSARMTFSTKAAIFFCTEKTKKSAP